MTTLLDEILSSLKSRADDVVMVCDEREVTGKDLLARSAEVQNKLIMMGIGSGDRVAIPSIPNAELIVSILAIWSAGASYVPIDFSEAPARRELLLAQSRAKGVSDELGNVSKVNDGSFDDGEVSPPFPDEAYVIFTSGSTGVPKGVSVSHRALTHYLNHTIKTYCIPDAGIIFPAQLPVTFDAAVTTLFPPLLTNNCLYPIKPDLSATINLAQLLAKVDCPCFIKITPSQLRLLGELSNQQDAARLHGTFVVGGEQLLFDDIGWLRSNPSVTIFNEYGPTETTVGCSFYRIRRDDPRTGRVPIGEPIAGVKFAVDPRGELTIVGPTVANGYINSAVSANFSRHADSSSFLTGDRVSQINGQFYFDGRMDDQIKILGHRVEMGEVEAAVKSHCGFEVAVVHAKGKLIAFTNGEIPNHNKFLRSLATSLPYYMLPDHIIDRHPIPLTAHGKIDRKALLASQFADTQVRDQLPGVGEIVREVWSSLVSEDLIADESNFFSTGGHSLSALRMAGRLSETLHAQIPPSVIFDNPTFRSFVEEVSAIVVRGQSETQNRTLHALSTVQRAILSAEAIRQTPGTFTVVTAIKFTMLDDWRKLEAAIREVLDEFPVFSCRLIWEGAQPMWEHVAGRSAEIPIEVTPLSGLEEVEVANQAEQLLTKERNRNIGESSPFRVLLLKPLSSVLDSSGWAALVTHHIFVDEHSNSIFWRQVAKHLSIPPQRISAPEIDFSLSSPPGSGEVARMTANVTSRISASLAAPLKAFDIDRVSPTSMNLMLPDRFTKMADMYAAQLSVPVAAVHGAIAARAIMKAAKIDESVVYTPVTQRRSNSDFDAVGCFVNAVPVLVSDEVAQGSLKDAVASWQKAVRFALDNCHADPAEVEAGLRAGNATWAVFPRVSISVETHNRERTEHLQWENFDLVEFPLKYDLAISIRLGSRGSSIFILWPEGRFPSGFCGRILELISAMFMQMLDQEEGLSAGPPMNGRSGDSSSGSSESEVRITKELHDFVATLVDFPRGEDVDLFQTGVRSLQLLQIARWVEERYHVRIKMLDIFRSSTLSSLASLIARSEPIASSLEQ
ncbi:AMP-binding protein [Rhizobium laguerreae]|uniref:non-ribosomal peptide synthetase n=1 Tax=Rhizobium laguerreae TaxID=1076926 RepID=UPI001C912FC5|nr:non-ribosomal peptide synthetase [Rhizobium laguerreae]MBY3425245.1 AMP-binding protein [Rhizobium laguerreae]